ncbi:MAG TPA: protein kinase [Gemmataceae bacterium]|nr:protein kinase [Gemmataceae bacterium]
MNEQAIFIAALQEEREKRAAYLDRVCGGHAALRQRIEVLLEAHDRAGSFLQQPAAAGLTDAYRPLSEGPGTVIGPYKLLQQIGEGGFGVVYMAEQQEPVRRKVALKIIKPGMDTKEVIARFESERQALALMDHPNVARVLDAGATDSSRPYFVMELVRGVPITEFCDKNHLPTGGRLELFNALCRAVQHAHQKGIIHRDLKPSNILVTLHDGQPVPKVIDFGVAKATSQQLTHRTLFTAYGQMIGTPAYMSPEQAEMSGLDIDTRSDIYSLGVLLYELLTGTTPLESKRLREAGYAEMQRLIREEEPPRPSTRLSSLGGAATILAGNRGTDVRRLAQLLRGDLDWIVMKALEKDRNRRYETPSAFAADVERFLHDEAILARPPSALYRLRKFARRNRAAVLTAATVAILLIIGIAGTSLGLVWAMRAEDDARHDATRAHDAEQLAAQRLVDVQLERDGANLAQNEAETTAGLLKVALAQEDSRRLAAHSSAELPTNPGTALLLALAGVDKSPARSASHNNALLAALRALREERTRFAPPFQTPEQRPGRTSFISVQLTPDGTHAVAVGPRSNDPGSDGAFAEDQTASAYVYDLHTGQVTATMKLPRLWFGTVAISPDGSLMAAATEQSVVIRHTDDQTVVYSDRTVRLWDMRTGKEVRVLKGHTNRVSSLCFDPKGERLLSAAWDGTARIWDVATGKVLHVLDDSKASLAFADFSSDGRRVLTVSTCVARASDGGPEALNNRTFREPVDVAKVVFDPPVRAHNAIRWAEGGGRIINGGDRGPAPRLWDAESGKQLAVLTSAKPGEDHAVAGFTADGARVATVSSSKTELWDAEDGKPVPVKESPRSTPDKPIEDGDRRLRIVLDDEGTYSETGKLLVWQSDKNLRDWRRAPGAARHQGHWWIGDAPGEVFLDASLRGPALLARSDGETVRVHDKVSGDEVAVLRGHEAKVTGAAFLPGGKRLLTASLDGTLRLWNLERPDPVVEIARAEQPPVAHATFLNGGKQVLAAPALDRFSHFAGKSVSLWDAATGTLVAYMVNEASRATSPLHKQLLGDLRDLDVSPDGTRLVTVHRDDNPCADEKAEPQPSPLYTPVRVWDLQTGKLLFVLEGLRRGVGTARFSPDGRRILTFSHGSYMYAIVRDQDKIIGSGSGGQLWARVDLWDAETGKHIRSLVSEAQGDGTFAVWSRDGKRILTNARTYLDNVAADIFDADSGQCVCRLKCDGEWIHTASFSPDGKLVLSFRNLNIGNNKELVEVWDAATGAKRFDLRGHTGNVTSAQFSPDSRAILTTSTDRTARLWDAATGETRLVLRGHRHVVRAGQFSPDGKWIATASTDGTARIWSTETGQEWMTLPAAHGIEFLSVEFSPDSRRILTASTDGTARIWPVDPLPLAASRKPRELTDDERAHFQVDKAP